MPTDTELKLKDIEWLEELLSSTEGRTDFDDSKVDLWRNFLAVLKRKIRS